jgi:hypothetical protein
MPLPRKLTKTIKKFAKRDGKISKKFFPFVDKQGDLPLYILSQYGRGDGAKWHILGVIDKWSAEFNQYRDRTMFSVSTVREDFGANGNETFFQIITRASHVAKYGEVYSLRDGDSVQAFQFEFAYKFFGQHEAQREFDLSEAVDEPTGV